MQKAWLKSEVSPGQFPTEYAVAGVQHDGKSYSLFAPAESVVPPERGLEGPGLVQVEVVETKGDLVLVRLPAQTFENGFHVTVKKAELSARPPARPASV